METKFYKKVKWLEPFLKSTKGLIPAHKIRVVKGFSVPYSVGYESTGASCSTRTGRSFTIAIRTHNQIFQRNDNGTYSPRRHSRRLYYDVLGDFAHELAHIVEWEHTTEHWILECRIQRRFIKLLQKWEEPDVAVRRLPYDRL